MPDRKYSKLEGESLRDEEFEYIPKARRYQHPSIFTSLWLIAAAAFLIGLLIAFGSGWLFRNVGKHDMAWLSKSLQCSTKLSGSKLTKSG